MKKTGLIGVAIAVASLSIAGCAREDSASHQKEIEELRLELEQLANAVGRMEFRIYELENQNSAANTAPAAQSQDAPTSVPKVEQPGNEGKFDLTPME